MTTPRRDSAAKLFRLGLLTNLFNPKATVIYLALIPQFIEPERGGIALQGFTLGAIQLTVSMAVNALLVLGAGSIAGFLSSRPRCATWQRRISGTLLGLVALALAREVPQRARLSL